eukprot:CAMPEP_0113915504 /NCGR_PEP_ID=MMETSP0780_2-20120614/31292_1 /TAXON_ID=652834 /ORGANISM="Palpitomonas bilix" /LENGTH=38 /DNA_ID=CAMNT_0000914127 /DNA_START=66 /DNA_END=179 /DNA_ORIENTATION=- /assembly_acc=CAM_ASM_000599
MKGKENTKWEGTAQGSGEAEDSGNGMKFEHNERKGKYK